MKLLLVSNSRNTVPATHDPPEHFIARFNQVVKLPRFCQICIVAHTMDDANNPKIHYVETPGLPVGSVLGNSEKGGTNNILGAIVSNSAVSSNEKWVDLNNPAELTLTELEIKIVNQDAELASGLSGLTELMFGYRPDPKQRGVTQYFK